MPRRGSASGRQYKNAILATQRLHYDLVAFARVPSAVLIIEYSWATKHIREYVDDLDSKSVRYGVIHVYVWQFASESLLAFREDVEDFQFGQRRLSRRPTREVGLPQACPFGPFCRLGGPGGYILVAGP